MDKELEKWLKLHQFHLYSGNYETKDLAHYLGVTPRTIERWIIGKSRPKKGSSLHGSKMRKLDNLTKDELVSLYINDRKSLEDIAIVYNVSRAAVYKRLKKYDINQRSKSESRLEAQKQGKLPQQFFDINENFFSGWSPEMAYVLGLIITDGCISRTGTVSLSMNDNELLEKVKKVLGSEHNITPSKHQLGLYCFNFTRKINQRFEWVGCCA